jgi:hypothetical protein
MMNVRGAGYAKYFDLITQCIMYWNITPMPRIYDNYVSIKEKRNMYWIGAGLTCLVLVFITDLSMSLWGTSYWWLYRRPSHTPEPKLSTYSSSLWSAWRRRNWYVTPRDCQGPSIFSTVFFTHAPSCFSGWAFIILLGLHWFQ